MKKILGTFFLLNSLLLSAQTTVYRKIAQRHDDFVSSAWQGIDSILFSYNNDAALTAQTNLKGAAGNSWDYFSRYTYLFTANGKVQEQLRENWNGSAWVNVNRYTYTYDASDRLMTTLYEVWNGSAWNPSGKIENSGYNAFNGWTLQVTSVYNAGWQNLYKTSQQFLAGSDKVEYRDKENWNTGTVAWDKFERLFYTYVQDSVGTITRSVADSNNNWKSADKYIYTYSSSPMLLQTYLQQYWNKDSVKFVDTTRVNYTYNAANQLELSFSERKVGAAWQAIQRTTTMYNGNPKPQEVYTEDFAGGWQNKERSVFSYAGGNMSEELFYLGAGAAWNLNRKTIFSYDANNNLIFKQRDDVGGANYVPFSRDFYYYQAYTVGLNEHQTGLTGFSTYPNPVAANLYVRAELSEQTSLRMTLFDLNGRPLLLREETARKGTFQTSLPTQHIPSGAYFLQVMETNSGKSSTEKVIIRH